MRPRDFKFRPGISVFLKNRHRFDKNSMYEQIHSMTNFPAMDSVLEQKLTDDELFKESLLRTARRSVASLSHMRQVDWVPFVTRHVADDFASHLRLYRMASEKYKSMRKKGGIPATENDLLSHFFDYELEMEKTLCRDLLCTTPNYENAYLHDVVDIVLYLIMPPEDFRCRPLRFLLREVIGKFLFVIFAVMEVRRLIVPLLDHFSEPDEMNQIMIWLLSEISPRPDDFIVCLENSNSVDELEAIYKSVQNERQVLRGKDSGGDQGTFVKQQLGSLDYVDSLIRKKLVILTNNTVRALSSNEDGLVQLPLHVILTNAVAVSYFIDYLQTGFKVSVEHQLKTLSNGETVGDEVLETIKEAAQFMFQQYLSQEAITRVPLEEAVISKLLSRIRNDEPFDYWFEQIQEKKSSFYPKMLSELGINNDEDRQETPASDAGSVHSAISDREQQAPSEYPKLTNLSFPGKKTFNNLDAHFLEKRTKALNLFLDCVLHPSMIEEYPELESILFDFLSQKEYQGNREPVAKKMMSAMFDPIKMGVKAVGSTVMAVPDQVYGGVSKVGAGINNAAKVIIQPLNGATKASIVDTDRVAAAITDDESTADNIPLRVLVLFVDEVFGVRARNAWFRRQLVRYVTLFIGCVYQYCF
uniref:PXA domain-containing protein n=1 Tax=Angiostrongylus cantonensis TaxID=6313 RepID=A0A0K0DLE3_ANGCA